MVSDNSHTIFSIWNSYDLNMDINRSDIQTIGFGLITIGILAIIGSFAVFAIGYSVVISDVLTAIGLPTLVIGILVYGFAEGFTPREFLRRKD